MGNSFFKAQVDAEEIKQTDAKEEMSKKSAEVVLPAETISLWEMKPICDLLQNKNFSSPEQLTVLLNRSDIQSRCKGGAAKAALFALAKQDRIYCDAILNSTICNEISEITEQTTLALNTVHTHHGGLVRK